MDLREQLRQLNPNIPLLGPEFDAGLLGVGWRFREQPVAVYDRDACIGGLMLLGKTYFEAQNYLEEHALCSWVGPSTPMILTIFTP